MASAIEHGIDIDFHLGTVEAWKYMLVRLVPKEVILRVLAGQTQRRVSDALDSTQELGKLTSEFRWASSLN